jgi:hypothetical protein
LGKDVMTFVHPGNAGPKGDVKLPRFRGHPIS